MNKNTKMSLHGVGIVICLCIIIVLLFFRPIHTNRNDISCAALSDYMYDCYSEKQQTPLGEKTVDYACNLYTTYGKIDRKTDKMVDEKQFKTILYNQCMLSANKIKGD